MNSDDPTSFGETVVAQEVSDSIEGNVTEERSTEQGSHITSALVTSVKSGEFLKQSKAHFASVRT